MVWQKSTRMHSKKLGDYKLKFNPEIATTKTNPRCRTRHILWFNPPYSNSVKTNVGAMFLKLVDKHFPKSNPLNKVINRKKHKSELQKNFKHKKNNILARQKSFTQI